MTLIRGLFANLPTALTDDGLDLHLHRMGDHIEWVIGCGIHGISSQLSSGEFAYLTFDERRKLTSFVAKIVGGRVPLLIGVSGNSTAETIALAKHAEGCGVTAVMVMPRSYYRLTDEEILRHFEAIRKSVSVPLGIYNNPFSTGVDINADLYRRLAELGNISVTKDGSGDIFRVSQVRAACPNVRYLVGTEYLLLPALQLGADGACIAINSVLPQQMLEIYKYAVVDPEPEKALQAYERLLPVLNFFRSEGVCRSAKAIANLVGRSLGPHRPPLMPLRAEAVSRLKGMLSEIEVPVRRIA